MPPNFTKNPITWNHEIWKYDFHVKFTWFHVNSSHDHVKFTKISHFTWNFVIVISREEALDVNNFLMAAKAKSSICLRIPPDQPRSDSLEIGWTHLWFQIFDIVIKIWYVIPNIWRCISNFYIYNQWMDASVTSNIDDLCQILTLSVKFDFKWSNSQLGHPKSTIWPFEFKFDPKRQNLTSAVYFWRYRCVHRKFWLQTSILPPPLPPPKIDVIYGQPPMDMMKFTQRARINA